MSSPEGYPSILRLKKYHLPNVKTLHECKSTSFNCKTIAAAISIGCSLAEINSYLQSYHKDIVKQQISHNIDGRHSAIFYAAERNLVDVVELLLDYGADPCARDFANTPLVAATIMWTRWTYRNVDKLVATLLSHGADPHCIPQHMWLEYIKDPVQQCSKNSVTSFAATWAKRPYRVILVETLNLTIRYHLHRASLVSGPSVRQRQIAGLHGCPHILRLPFHGVGQDHALEIVMNKIMAYNTLNQKKPLVLAFSGLSGHGKTELATSLGSLLGTEACNVDMSKIQNPTSLYGAAAPYAGFMDGSPLNNYLASHTAKRCIIFLDEFDKTNHAVRQSLLTILDSGVGMDLRTNTVIDVTKSIWILATNKGDTLIGDFYDKHLKGKSDSERRRVPVHSLQKQLFRLFIDEYTPAVTGRISSFVPFFPFTRDEAAVVAHKFIRNLSDKISKPIDLISKPARPLGHIQLSIVNDGNVCKSLSEDCYIRELGARSIQNCVDELAQDLFMLYVSSEEEITEATNGLPHYRYEMHLHSTADGDGVEVGVRDAGTVQVMST